MARRRIDWAHPAIKNCGFLLSGDKRNLINGRLPDVSASSVASVPTEVGLAVEYIDDGPDQYADNSFDGADRVTAYALAKFDSLTTGADENRILVRAIASGLWADSDFVLDVKDGKLTGLAGSGVVGEFAEGSTTIVVGTWYLLALRWVSGGKVEVFLDGVSDGIAATAVTTTMATSGTYKEIWTGGLADLGDDDVDGQIAFAAAFREYHSPELIKSISNNPWQLFKQQTIILPLDKYDGRIVVVEEPGSAITGSLAETLDDAASAATGELEAEGTLAEVLANATSATAGELEAEGTLAETLDDGTSAVSGELEAEGTVVETLDNATSATAGELEAEGTVARTLGDATSATAGELEAEGSLSETLDDATSVATGEMFFLGTLAETLDDVTSVATGEMFFEASLAETLDDATSAISGEIYSLGTLAETMEDVTGVGTGNVIGITSVSGDDIIPSNEAPYAVIGVGFGSA
jgi:hypothetical protein